MNSRMEMLQELWLRGVSAPDAKSAYRKVYGDAVSLTNICTVFHKWDNDAMDPSIQYFVMQKLRFIGAMYQRSPR